MASLLDCMADYHYTKKHMYMMTQRQSFQEQNGKIEALQAFDNLINFRFLILV